MAANIKDFDGLYRRGAKKAWRVKWPVQGEYYYFFGSRRQLEPIVKQLMERAGRTTRPTITEMHNI